jgi:radical SAM superfamily enzyme YgiQ (UPF0313 family)
MILENLDCLMVNSPLFAEGGALESEDVLPPLGLGYIVTSLKNAGFKVHLMDCVHENISVSESVRRITRCNPKVLAFNVFTTNFALVQELVLKLSDTIPHIVVGGVAVQSLYKEILDWEFEGQLDVVRGDGELFMVNLFRGALVEKPVYETTQRRYFSVDRNSQWFVHNISNLCLDRTVMDNEPLDYRDGHAEAHLVAGRGCVYDCAFCGAAKSLMKDIPVRERSTESLIEELDDIHRNYPQVSSIRVLDDLFLKNTASLARAATVFSGFQFWWRATAHIRTFSSASDEHCSQLQASGCRELFIGVESGSPRVLREIGKVHDVDLIKTTLARLFRSGIGVKSYFIYGFPGEQESDFHKTYKLAEALRDEAIRCNVPFKPSVFQYRPYHGTRLYENLRQKIGFQELVQRMTENERISDMKERKQFSFHAGNFSDAPLDAVIRYIRKTAALATGCQGGSDL